MQMSSCDAVSIPELSKDNLLDNNRYHRQEWPNSNLNIKSQWCLNQPPVHIKIYHLPTPRGVYVSSENKEYEKLKVFWHSQALTAILWVKDIVGWLALTALAWLEMTYLVSIKSAHFDEGGCPQGWPSGCLTSCDSPAHSLQLWYFRTLSTNYNTLYNY